MANANREGSGDGGGPLHPEGGERPAELRDLEVLDAPDPRFDRLTRLAARMLDTRAAHLSLVHADRMQMKSSYGRPPAETAQVEALCARAVSRSGPLVIEDTRTDPRFAGRSWAGGPNPPVFYAGVPVRGAAGLPVGTLSVLDEAPRRLDARELEILSDIAELAELELQRAAPMPAPDEPKTDPSDLTALLSRQPGMERLDALLALATAAHRRVALIIADIVDFNAINSAFGRAEGDRILRRAAAQLERSAPAGAAVFRIQGDQFGLAFDMEGSGIDKLDSVQGAIASTFSEPIEGAEQPVRLQLALGTAIFPDRATTSGELMDRAFLALRRGQERRTLAEVFTNELEERLVREVAVEQALRAALVDERLTLAYQPKIELRSGRILSLEALCRWTDPDLGFVSPAEFIPAAERAGLIVELGRQVLVRAVQDILRIREDHPHMTVSVNVAAAQLEDEGFADSVLAILERAGAPASALELEVVESSLIERLDVAAEVIARLRSAGVAFSLDDFGTGYSSLAYLHRLPVETLKIDRSFVSNMSRSKRDAALVCSIVSMAQVLEYEVVAEGVETQEEARMLESFGCPIGQGYLWSRPLPFDELLRFLEAAARPEARP